MLIHRISIQSGIIISIVAFEVVKLKLGVSQLTDVARFVISSILGEICEEITLYGWVTLVYFAFELAEFILVFDENILAEHKGHVVIVKFIGVYDWFGEILFNH